MTDEQGTSEGFPGLIQPWITRLRKITEELVGMTGLSETLFALSIPALQGLPLFPRRSRTRSPAPSPRSAAASRRCKPS
jgi:hypothetical protein